MALNCGSTASVSLHEKLAGRLVLYFVVNKPVNYQTIHPNLRWW